MSNAAAAGRLVVILLFAANALSYFTGPTWYSVAGIALAIVAAAAGYFAASYAEWGDDGFDQTILFISMMACVASGLCFVLGAF